jgi:hypothetical protein
MRTTVPAHRVRVARAVGVLVILGCVWLFPRPASAQLGGLLGNLIVTMTSPASGSTVRGTVPVSASVTIVGSLTVMGVQFRVDGVNIGAEDTSAPYSVPWNTLTATNGSHTLTAVARDLLGVRYTSDPVIVTVDNSPPVVSINQAAGQADPTNGAAVGFTVVFSEPVNGFTSGDVTIGGTAGGTKTAVVSGGPSTYTVTVSGMTSSGTVIAAIADGVAHDAAGNGNTASTSSDNVVTFDVFRPAVTINQAAGQADPTASSPINFSVVFSEPVIDFTSADVSIAGTAGGTKTAIVSGGPAVYTLSIGGMTNGTVTASIAAGAARDAAGNTSTASTSTDNSVTFNVDTTPPAVTINQAAGQADPTSSAPINFTAVFSEPVSGFTAADVTIGGTAGGTRTAVVSGGPSTYAIAVSGMTTSGTVVVTIAAGRATDAAGNGNTASTSTDNSVTFNAPDTSAPTVTINQAAGQADPASSAPINFTAIFSEPVNGFTAADVTITGTAGGTRTAVVSGGPSTYTIAVSGMTTNGTVVTTIAAGVATDSGGNGNAASTSTDNTVTFGSAPPAVTRVEDTSASISYTPTGSWIEGYTDNRGWSGGTAALGGSVGQRATLTFTGTGVRWIGFRGPQTGIANVYLDAQTTPAATIDLYAANEEIQAMIFEATGLASGTHTIIIEVTGQMNPAAVDRFVVIDAFDVLGSSGGTPSTDTSPPTVVITSPGGGATVTGTVPVTADASDNTAVSGVQFLVDGVAAGAEDTAAPYSIAWDTRTVPDGAHVLTAVARDAAGNTRTSAPVTVTVSSTAPPPAATATRFENTDTAVIYTDGTPAPGRPEKWWYGSRSRGWSGATAAFNRSAGARATFSFNGTAVSWIGFRAHWAGIARVYVDGGFVSEVDLFEPPNPGDRENGEKDQVVVYRAAGLAPGPHTLTIESTGRKHGGDTCNPDPATGGDPANCASDYAVVVDAFDVEPAGPPPVIGTRFEQSTQTTGTWTPATNEAAAWSGGSAGVATSAATMTFTFRGTEVRWVGLRGRQTGIARVHLDGAFQAEIDTWSATDVQAVVFTATNLAAGTHTLVIEATGRRNAAATDSRIVVDALDVRSRIEDTNRSINYTGSWTIENADKAWSGTSANVGSGTAAYAVTAGAQAQFTFTGTSVAWIGYRGPLAGIAEVWLDGVSTGQIDLYSATEQVRAVVFAAANLTPGSHTLRIDVTGQRNPAAVNAVVLVDAFDVTLPSATPTIVRVQESDASIAYTDSSSTSWIQESRNTLRSGESSRISVTTAGASGNGAQVTVTFTGTGIRWIGERGRARGIARVSLDGGAATDIDAFALLQDEYQAVLFSATGLASGTHTLTITVTGDKNPSSHGTNVIVDAFEIFR